MLSLVAWVQHPNAHQALDDELRLEEILAVLCKSLWGAGDPVRRPPTQSSCPPSARPAHGPHLRARGQWLPLREERCECAPSAFSPHKEPLT